MVLTLFFPEVVNIFWKVSTEFPADLLPRSSG